MTGEEFHDWVENTWGRPRKALAEALDVPPRRIYRWQERGTDRLTDRALRDLMREVAET